MNHHYVVDASVAIKLFVVEPGSDIVDRLFAQLTADPPAQFYVPDLFYLECTNILWKYVRRFGYAATDAQQDVADLRTLALIPVAMADLLEPALALALQYDITVYDAAYAVLAEQLDLPLVTADAALTHHLAGSGIRVYELKDITI